jgi:transposase InsO family protein
MDLTVMWVLGILPVWIVGVVEYHGSRVIAMRPVRWPSTSAVIATLDDAFEREGKPLRLITDNDPRFRGVKFQTWLAGAGVKHTRIRPAHPWTNGRIERAFRTYKETIRRLVWMLSSFRQLERFSADFVRWHNQHRPHMSNAGLTPEEVALGARAPRRAVGRVMLFDGRLAAYQFG